MLRLAGEIADGVILWLCNPDYIRDVVVPTVREGREKAGKELDGFDIVAAVPSAVTDDPTRPRDQLRSDLFTYFHLPYYRAMIEVGSRRSGFDPDEGATDAIAAGGATAIGPSRGDRVGAALPRLRRHVALHRRRLETDFDATLEALAKASTSQRLPPPQRPARRSPAPVPGARSGP